MSSWAPTSSPRTSSSPAPRAERGRILHNCPVRARAAASLVAGLLLAAAVIPAAPAAGQDRDPTPRVILDTDLSRWWDDATAVGIANVLDRRGDIRLLGILSNVANPIAVAAIDALNTAYGNPDLPVGAAAGSAADTFAHGFTDDVVRRLRGSIDDSSDVPRAVNLYRRLLARQPDRSVTLVSVGGYTNLAALLASGPGQGSRLDGRRLVAAKVRRLVQMDGVFPGGGPAFTNQKLDLAAAEAVVGGTGWPTPIAWVDGLSGVQTMVGSTLCTTVAADHPMRVVYESLFECGPPGDGNWDAPTLLYAVGDVPAVFSELGQGGAAVLNDQGGLAWQDDSTRPSDLYVRVADQDALNRRIDELLER